MTASRNIYRKRGTGTISSTGHRNIGRSGTKVGEHVLMCERILGRPLPPGAEVHHVNGKPADNRNENFVICPNHEYHFLLHQRTRAYEACGHANWRTCCYCKKWDDPANMRPAGQSRKTGKAARMEHVECSRAWWREYHRRRQKAA